MAGRSFTIPQLDKEAKINGSNYAQWEDAIFNLLVGLDLWRFVDGSTPRPSVGSNTPQTL